jgi:hypothetical protein
LLYLLLAMAICLLVPWLPVLLLRLAPVRPAPPLSPEELERLVVQLYPKRIRKTAQPHPADPRREALALPRQGNHQTDRMDTPSTPVHKTEGTASSSSSAGGAHTLSLQSYRWVGLIVSPIFIVSMLALGILWALVFDWLGERHAETFPPGEFVFKPAVYWAIFGVPAIFLGIFSSVAIVEPLTRILLGHRYTEYCHWEQARRGLHGQAGVQRFGKRFVLFAWFLGGILVLWVLLAMNWYVRLTENEIAVKPLFGIKEQVYPYNRVQQVVLTSHTRVKNEAIPKEGLHLRFDDGQTWSTGQSFRVPDAPEERKRLLEFLSRKTGKPLTRAKMIEHIPGW